MIINFNKGNGGGGEYVLPKASATKLGGIKVGNNLSIDANGVLSATGGEGGAKQYYYCDMERHLDEAAPLIDEMLDKLKSGDSNFLVGAFRDWNDYPAGTSPTLENYEDPDGWGYEGVKFRSVRYDTDGYVFRVSDIILKRNYDTEGNIDYSSSESVVYQYDGGGEGGGQAYQAVDSVPSIVGYQNGWKAFQRGHEEWIEYTCYDFDLSSVENDNYSSNIGVDFVDGGSIGDAFNCYIDGEGKIKIPNIGWQELSSENFMLTKTVEIPEHDNNRLYVYAKSIDYKQVRIIFAIENVSIANIYSDYTYTTGTDSIKKMHSDRMYSCVIDNNWHPAFYIRNEQQDETTQMLYNYLSTNEFGCEHIDIYVEDVYGLGTYNKATGFKFDSGQKRVQLSCAAAIDNTSFMSVMIWSDGRVSVQNNNVGDLLQANVINIDTNGNFVNEDGGTLDDNAKEGLFWDLYRTIQDGLGSASNKNTKVMFQLNKNCVDESIRDMWERNYSIINSLREGNDYDMYISAFVDVPDGTYLGKWKMRYYYDEELQMGVVSFEILKWQKID